MGDKNLEMVTDWLQVRFKDELKLVELRQDALLAELRMYLGQAPWIPEVQVTPPQDSHDSPPTRLRPPGLSNPHESEGSVGWVSRNGSQESALSGSWTSGSKGSKESFFKTSLFSAVMSKYVESIIWLKLSASRVFELDMMIWYPLIWYPMKPPGCLRFNR